MTAAWALILVVLGGSPGTTHFTSKDKCDAAAHRMEEAITPFNKVIAKCVLVGPGLTGDEGIPVFSAAKRTP